MHGPVSQSAPSHATQGEQETNPDRPFDGEDNQNPLKTAIAAKTETDGEDREETDAVDAAKGQGEQIEHPEPINDEAGAPTEGDDWAEGEFAGVDAAGDLFDAQIAFADDDLTKLENQKDRSEQERGGHGVKGGGSATKAESLEAGVSRAGQRGLDFRLPRREGLLGIVEEKQDLALLAEAEGVELLGEGLAKDAVRKTHAGEISGDLALEIDPEVWIVVLHFAADEMEDGHAIVGGAEKKRRAEVGEQRKVEGGRCSASEADGAAGAGGECGL